jgi:geranylgeranyl transferase type-2 subunit alpha
MTVHAWDYRRYVLESLVTTHSPAQELAYTTRKIELNFSNFSAWHQRSKVYTDMWERDIVEQKRRTFKDQGSLLSPVPPRY